MDPTEQPSWTGGDAPDKEKMDQIRARRLAKLGTTSKPEAESQGTDSGTTSSQPEPSGSSSSKPPATVANNTSSAENLNLDENPFKQLNVSSPSSLEPSTGSTRVTRKRSAPEVDDEHPATKPQARKPTAQMAESDDDFAHRILSQIFRITVDPHNTSNNQGQRLTFLPNLNQDMNDSEAPLKLSVGTLDQALNEACSSWPQNKSLMGYLLPCWKRALSAARRNKVESGPRFEVHDEAKRLCISNCLFALTMPQLYGREDPHEQDTLVPYLLQGPLDDGGLDFDWIREVIKRFDEDTQFPALFNDAMVKISLDLGRMSMADAYRPYMQAISTYSHFPILLKNLTELPTFNHDTTAPGLEVHTILGPFFRLSPLQSEAIKSFFPGARSMDKSRVVNAQESMRQTQRTHQAELFALTNAFIRAGPDSRSKTLDWFAQCMNKNHKRRAIQVDLSKVGSEGFMMNITTVMDRFCEPFMDNNFSKIDKIDVRYFQRSPRVDISDETKINADQATADAFYEQKEEGDSNFISEAFFLTLAAHHYGSEASSATLKNLDRDIKYIEKRLKAMEAERPKFVNVPHQLKIFEDTLKKHTALLEKSIALKYAIEGALLDPHMQGISLRFMRYVAVWLLRLATRSDYKPGKESEMIKLPLQLDESKAFSCLPEYCLQNIVDNFKFIFRYVPQILMSAVGEEMIALCITLLESSDYIKNPYLKSSLVSLLYSGTWPYGNSKKGIFGQQLISLPFANDYLLHALMKFYIECELAGGNAFYDKFNIRYEIFQVMKCIWENEVYQHQLKRESKVNRDFFVRFVNMLLNDATYVLDEAFTKFPKIKALEDELAQDPNMSQEDRQKKEEEISTLGGHATSYMQLANETLEMMKLFTQTLTKSFTMPEIVSRLASMLNYNIDTLAGSKATAELRVNNKEKYHFRPLQLVVDFTEIYLNLGTSEVFVEAVAADGRSYKPVVLDAVSRILRSRSALDATDIERWEKLKSQFASAKQILDQAELDLGEIPAEFEDPIMGDLMKDPVLLPSKHIVDRSTIVQHLLSDPKDPFTRQAMTVEDAIPQDELRERIEKWRDERIEAAKKKLRGEGMDTSED